MVSYDKTRIFTIRNRVNDKKFVSYTTNRLCEVFNNYRQQFKRGKTNNALMEAFKDIGIDQFYITLEEESNCANKDMVNERVHYFVCLYDSIKNGYNSNRTYKRTTKEPIPEVVEAKQSVSEPVPEVVEPVPEVVEPVPEVVEPIPEVVEPVPEVVEPIPEVVKPIPEVLEPIPEVEEPITRRSGRTFDNPLYRYYLVKSILTQLYGEEKANKIQIDKFDVDTIHALLNKALKKGISINF